VWQVQTKYSSLFFQILWDGCGQDSLILDAQLQQWLWSHLSGLSAKIFDFTVTNALTCFKNRSGLHSGHFWPEQQSKNWPQIYRFWTYTVNDNNNSRAGSLIVAKGIQSENKTNRFNRNCAK
jgi:hypothetical protein